MYELSESFSTAKDGSMVLDANTWKQFEAGFKQTVDDLEANAMEWEGFGPQICEKVSYQGEKQRVLRRRIRRLETDQDSSLSNQRMYEE